MARKGLEKSFKDTRKSKMNQSKVKLFKSIFPDKNSFRAFKAAYAHAPLRKRLELIKTAKKIRSGGPVKHMEINNAD